MADINMRVTQLTAVPVPVDPTLQNEGEAADAKAVGIALAGKASVAQADVKVNGQAKDINGEIDVYADNVPYEEESELTVKAILDDHEQRITSAAEDAAHALESCALAETALQTSGGTMTGAIAFQSGNYAASVAPQAITSDIDITLPKESGTLALTSLADGTYNLGQVMLAGMTLKGAVYFYLPCSVNGKSVEFKSNGTLRVVNNDGFIYPYDNGSGTISASAYTSNITQTVYGPSAVGITVTLTAKNGGWKKGGGTAVATDNVPCTLLFSSASITVS